MLALANGGCGGASAETEQLAHADSEIVGGEDAPAGALPYMVGLFYASDEDDAADPVADRHFCGGTLVDAARGLVITAAHCVSEEFPLDGDWFSEDPANWQAGTLPPEMLTVTIGSHRLSEITQDDLLQVVEVIAHPGFDFYLADGDIAILRVAGVDPRTPTPRLIGHRFQDPFLVTPGLTATVAGWGDLEEDGDVPDVLQWARLPMIDRGLCNFLHSQELEAGEEGPVVTASMMCAGPLSGARDACYGDSGGPLLVRDLNGKRVLAGVVSWGSGCAKPWRPGVYANVLALRPWFDACTSAHGACERLPAYPMD